MATISIIIPAYNAERTIAQCLASIFRQTFTSFEVIVVDDGSTDRTSALLTGNPRRLTILNQTNQGANAARNAGEKLATGTFLLFCDADVSMRPTMLAEMLASLEANPSASYAYSSFRFGWKTFRLWPFDPSRLRQMPCIHTTSLIRREHFPGFDRQLSRLQDWDLWLTMLEAGHSGVWVPRVLFTVRSGGTMSSWLPKFIYHFPLPGTGKRVADYHVAVDRIRQKHKLQ